MSRLSSTVLLITASVTLSSCGAGVISGAILGSGGGGSGAVATLEPSITLSVDRGPLDIAQGERFEAAAVLSNIVVPSSAQVLVDLVVLARPDVVERQADVVIDQTTNATIRWRLVTDQIRALFVDPTAQDVPVLTRLTARGADGQLTVLGEAPFTLLRKRVAQIDAAGVVIPITGGIVELTVTPRLADSPQIEVQGVPMVTSVASVESRQDDLLGDFTRIRVAIPAGDTPQELGLVVIDRDAGRSTTAYNVFYAPQILGVTDRSGSTDGDELLSLVGAGLIPLDFGAPGGPMPEIGRVEVVFRKGNREMVLGPAKLTGSTPNALTMRSPVSPDGHPGNVSIAVRVRVPRVGGLGGTRIVSDEINDLYAYAASLPAFEPRGIGIQRSPLDIDFGPLTRAPGDAAAADAAVLFRDAIDGVGLVRVLTGNGHGMLGRVGRFVSTGEAAAPSQRQPIDLCVGDYGDDEFLDVIVGHVGTNQLSSSSLLRNGQDLRGMFPDFVPVFDVVQRTTRSLSRVDLDQDGDQDVFIASLADAGIASSNLGFSPVWFSTEFPESFLPGLYVVAQPLDLEDDGQPDVLCIVRADPDGVPGGILRDHLTTVRFRDGEARAFGPFPLNGLVGENGRTAHAVPLGRSGEPPRIGLVVEASPAPAQEFQLLVIELTPRGRPILRDVLNVPHEADGSVFAVSRTLAADIDGDGRIEWILASRNRGLRIYEFVPGRLRLQAVEPSLGEEPVGEIHSLEFAPVSADRGALYVTHDVNFDSIDETRVTTVLVAADGSLVSAKARLEFDSGDSIRQLVALDQAGHRIVALFDGWLAAFESDSFGQLVETVRLPVGNILCETMRRVDVDDRSAVLFLDSQGRIGLWFDGESSVRMSPFDLLTAFGEANQVLSNSSRLDAGDFDGDGLQDLVVMWRVDPNGSIGTGDEPLGLAWLRGRPVAESAKFPFELRSIGIRTDLDSPTSIAAGNFAIDGADELAVAIPSQGVRFFSLSNGGQFDAAEADPSRSVASEGRSPDLVRAVDFDQDGIDDLATLSLTRSVVRIYLQQDARVGKVNIAGYIFADEAPIPPGVRADLEPVDVDGDNLEDLVISVVSERGQPTVGAVLWDGTDRLRRAFSVPSARIIGMEPTTEAEGRRFSFAIADTNHDGTSDIVIGWAEDAFGGRPSFLHTLFGSRR